MNGKDLQDRLDKMTAEQLREIVSDWDGDQWTDKAREAAAELLLQRGESVPVPPDGAGEGQMGDVGQNNVSVPPGNRTKLTRNLAIVLGALGIALVAWFLWPSHYEYTKMNLGMIGWQEVREDRFTGEKEVCGGDRWQRIIIYPSGRVSVPEGLRVRVGGGGGNKCSRLPRVVTAVLACIGLGEAHLVFLLVYGMKKRKKTG